MRTYALHLLAGQEAAKANDLSKIEKRRMLGLFLSEKTLKEPFAVVEQAKNHRKMYIALYKGDTSYSNSIVVGVEEGQNGRVVTVMLTGKSKDKKAALRDIKSRLSGENTQKVLYVAGLSGHSRPTTEHRTSQGSVSLRPSGDSSITQNQQSSNTELRFSVNLNNNTNEHSESQGASSMPGMQETSRKWLDGIANTFAKKLHLKGDRIITEERGMEAYEDITIKQYWLNSPSRIADKVKAFRLFFHMGDRAMDKLTKLRSDYQRKYDEAMKTAASRQNTHIRRLQRKASRTSRNSARGI